MGAPTTHQIQDFGVLWNLFLKELANSSYGSVVYMNYEPRGFVKYRVVLFIFTLKIFRSKSGIGYSSSKPPAFLVLGGSGELYHLIRRFSCR
ncbi:MAG: hypothetical protein Ct9H300mP11_04380 [Chloroflexota bacterium]|nr:MAG: hypothetical protein Ct9H300mP11_04380 [Chloroflexota bacterium]